MTLEPPIPPLDYASPDTPRQQSWPLAKFGLGLVVGGLLAPLLFAAGGPLLLLGQLIVGIVMLSDRQRRTMGLGILLAPILEIFILLGTCALMLR